MIRLIKSPAFGVFYILCLSNKVNTYCAAIKFNKNTGVKIRQKLVLLGWALMLQVPFAADMAVTGVDVEKASTPSPTYSAKRV